MLTSIEDDANVPTKTLSEKLSFTQKWNRDKLRKKMAWLGLRYSWVWRKKNGKTIVSVRESHGRALASPLVREKAGKSHGHGDIWCKRRRQEQQEQRNGGRWSRTGSEAGATLARGDEGEVEDAF